VVAVDVDAENLKRIEGIGFLASGEQLPFMDSSFDVVFCLDTVHLLSDVEELDRVMRRNGRAVVTRYCSEYNKGERMAELKNLVTDWELLDEFFVGTRGKELDAVVVCRAL
ncbi:MAG: methyltransferase domain-containing protein, partial [Candidatus Hydrothermarchaeaceae archaeon]